MLRKFAIVAIVVLATAVAMSAVSPISAMDPCTAQINAPYSTTTRNPYSNTEVTLPVSVTCAFSGGQLYAVGNAFDSSTGTPLSSVISTLPSVSKGNQFDGQLVFIIPAADSGHHIYFTVSIYSGTSNISVNFSNGQQAILNAQLLATVSSPPLPVPEFPFSTVMIMTMALLGALIVAKRKHDH